MRERLANQVALGPAPRRSGGLAGLALVLALAGAACSASGPATSARPSLLQPEVKASGEASGAAEWRHHPRRPGRLERRYSLEGGRALYVGASGERWLEAAGQRGARAAAMLAPEPLVAALRARRAPWVFVGQSGSSYEAAEPLGPFTGSSAPPVELAKVEGAEDRVLGVSREGRLWLGEDAGLTWSEVGPASARFADVLLEPPHALALEVPERLWQSEDGGRSWQPVDQEPVGARVLARDEEAGPVVASVLGAHDIRLGASPLLSPLGRQLRPAEPALEAPSVPGRSAQALAAGRAFDSGGRYLELVLGLRPAVLSGPSLGELERRPAPELAACQEVRVAGFERWVYAACMRERSGSSRQIELMRSDDGGRSFSRPSLEARGDPAALRLAVGGSGVLLATGLCPPADSVAGCRPQGIFRYAPGASSAAPSGGFSPVAAPALEEHARGLTFSADGRTAYAVGARTKNDSLFVFVSSDLERGFDARPLTLLEEGERRGPGEVVALTASIEGQLSLVLEQPSGAQRLAILDASGRTLSLSAPPVAGAAIGAYGRRALAVGPDAAWATLNGGAEWEHLGPLPRSVCGASAGRCSVPVRCEADGCTIGESLSRLGWRSPSARGVTLPLPAPPRPSSAPRRALAPAWSCELTGREWAPLRGVERLPDAGQAALGSAAWFALASDDDEASAGLYVAESAGAGRPEAVRYVELLGPAARGSSVAYRATLQVEGAAALRYELPAGGPRSGSHLRQVEVAWHNLFEGAPRRARIPDAGELLPGDYIKSDGAARRAQPDLLSISSGGVFVRAHRQPEAAQETFFLDGARVEVLPPLRSPLGGKNVSHEMARLGGESVHLAFVDQGATVVRARRQGSTWQLQAMTLGYPDPQSFSIEQHRDIAYAAGRPSLHSTTLRRDGTAEGALFPLQAQGSVLGGALPAPTQADLGEAPRPCTPELRAESPRVIAPLHPGLRRPLLVSDAVEPARVLLTHRAVLHGTPGEPCAAAFDAELVKTSAASTTARESALLSLTGSSWLFRVAPDSTRRDARVEYRSMRCRPDAGVELPPELYELPGTSRRD